MPEERNVPQIRFKGFTDPWEQRQLGELVNRLVRKNVNNESTLPLTISAQHGLVDQIAYFNNRVASRNVSGYYLVFNGDFAYNKSSSDGYPFGTVKRLDLYEKGVLSTLYIVFAPKGRLTVNSDFLAVFFETDRWHRGVAERAAEGARNHGLLNIAADDFLEIEISVAAENAEQKEIGRFHTRLDRLISLHQRKLDKLTNVKKSLLEKMFPKPGSDVPEIRFAGFTAPWEQRQLGEVCTFRKGQGYSKADVSDKGTPILLYGRLYTHYQTCIRGIDTYADERADSVISRGGEVLVPASGESAEEIAVAASLDRPGVILGGDLNVATPSGVLKPEFLAYGITYGPAHQDLAMRAQGKSVVHVHNSDIAEVQICYPVPDEQNLFSTLFIRLDSLIALHQRKLDMLENVKKSLLEKMFV
ncbi:restriction endonuclease subunit S [Trueperella bernardiae]|uniref:restriction endonuclease subunit S n=1 Tax=Trueperella bernardiae TaxID=59561 RepID=UPI0025573BAA|nr:restriction endonuclease subunit S [Trueperella bernardiae]WIM08120.1 restriction endonuclease subunit S [Trueperella bernardiae]